MRTGRELRLALLLVLAGAAVLLVGAGRSWVDVVVPVAPPLPPEHVVRTGSDLAGALSPLALVGLAGLAALAATRGRGRVLVGLVLAAAGAAACAATVSTLAGGAPAAVAGGLRRPGQDVPVTGGAFTAWPWLALLGGVLLALGGLVVTVRGARWAALSARYEAPAARREKPPAAPEVAAWDALDRGEDPTQVAGAPEGEPGPGAGTGAAVGARDGDPDPEAGPRET